MNANERNTLAMPRKFNDYEEMNIQTRLLKKISTRAKLKECQQNKNQIFDWSSKKI